jgi:alanine racemase
MPLRRQRPNGIGIDLDAFLHNLRTIKAHRPGAAFLLPVKADAYGHGILAISYAAMRSGEVDVLGVAHVFEAVPLRQYGVDLPILVLGPLLPEDFDVVVEYNLIPTIVDLKTAQAFDRWLGEQGLQHRAHVKVDTGMSRYGVLWDAKDLPELFALENLRCEGIFTHIACAENWESPSNALQIQRFEAALASLPQHPHWVHFANSASALHFGPHWQTMIRPGLASYGYNPLYPEPSPIALKPVLELHATVRQIKTLPASEGISYGHRIRTQATTRIAAIAIGYGDGLLRTPHPDHGVWIRNRFCRILGTICMDTCMVEIGDLDIHVGESVQVIGTQDTRIHLEEVATRFGTIPYELTCAMARRLYRHYRWQGQWLRWDQLREHLAIPAPLFEIPF